MISHYHYHQSHLLMHTFHHHHSIHHLTTRFHEAYLKLMEIHACVASTTAPSSLALGMNFNTCFHTLKTCSINQLHSTPHHQHHLQPPHHHHHQPQHQLHQHHLNLSSLQTKNGLCLENNIFLNLLVASSRGLNIRA